jgi:ClpP class serine protease
MGVYSEYLDRQMDFEALAVERKKQLARIAKIRSRDVLVYAADLNAANAPIDVQYDDLLPINDQLANLDGERVDLILETGGGSGEVAEDIVDLLHDKYEEVGVIVPGTAKSAGTLMVMAGNEILMEPASSLGPIDAQIQWQGKVFSADALLEGIESIKEEVEKTGKLNKAFIPILQGISPGELQSAENALEFARKLVTEWLVRYKFRNWDKHSSTGKEVTEKERKARAREVAKKLCDHKSWLTHGRSIKLPHLEEMRLKITNYREEYPDLADAVRRYHTLLRMTFESNMVLLPTWG